MGFFSKNKPPTTKPSPRRPGVAVAGVTAHIPTTGKGLKEQWKTGKPIIEVEPHDRKRLQDAADRAKGTPMEILIARKKGK